jgi:GNAT superfamily N-acetyltransferase
MVTGETLVVRTLGDEDAAFFAHLATGLGQGRLSRDRNGLIALGAWVESKPAGLFLGVVKHSSADPYVNVVTLRVAEQHRRRGVATVLLSEAEQCARDAGCHLLTGLVADGSPEGPAAQALTERAGWMRFRLTRTIYKSPYPSVGKFHWAGRAQPWPEHFEVFAWRDLTDEDRAWLVAHWNDPFYFDLTLSPFKRGRVCTRNSVGLRVKGEIAGWAVSWPLSADPMYSATMTGTRLFVRGDLQRRGYGAMLLAEHFQGGPAAGIDCAIFSIAPDNRFMLRFMKKHLQPYVSDFREIWEVRKVISLAIL